MRSRFDMNFPSTLRHKTPRSPAAEGQRSSSDSHNTTTVGWGDPMESTSSALTLDADADSLNGSGSGSVAEQFRVR